MDGDRYEQRFVVREGAYAHISTGAATKLAEMRYNYSGLTQAFELEEDSYLEYLPEPTIPCRHTRFIADTAIRIAPSATLFYSEIYMSGRKYFDRGETFQYDILSVCSHAERPDGEQLFREKFIIRPEMYPPSTLGAMNGYDVFANVIAADAAGECRQHLRADAGLLDRERGWRPALRACRRCGAALQGLG